MTEKPDTFFEKYAAIGVNSLVSSWGGAGMAAKGQGWATELVSAVSGGAIFGVVDGMFNKKVTFKNVAIHAATSTAMSSLSYFFTRRDVEKNFVPVGQYMTDVHRAYATGKGEWAGKIEQEKDCACKEKRER